MKAITTTLALAVAMAGCATASKDISSSYVSPIQYQHYDCDQMAAESQRIQLRVNQLSGRLDEAADNDKALVGVGVLLFWPVLFAVGGTKNQEAEYARLKGEYEALQQASIGKKCPAAVVPVLTIETKTNPTEPASEQVATAEKIQQPITQTEATPPVSTGIPLKEVQKK